jgi:hypothetical protein
MSAFWAGALAGAFVGVCVGVLILATLAAGSDADDAADAWAAKHNEDALRARMTRRDGWPS